MKCGYLNPNDTCNCTLLCTTHNCIAIDSNFTNVEQKANNMVEYGNKLLKELEEGKIEKRKTVLY